MSKFEKSCGAVIFKQQDDQRLYLTVEYKIEKGYWGLVKGHVETGETELETAQREIYEETGLQNLSFIDGFRTEIQYQPKSGVDKLVVFFLAQTTTDKVEYLWDEHIAHQWLPYPAILEQLTYGTDKGVVEKAHNFFEN